jgi:DNA-binding response OmpR family regulator
MVTSDVKDREVVLLVEDDGEMRSLIRRSLRREAYQVFTADDAEEAAELASCLSCGGPHLILTDPQHPDIKRIIELTRRHEKLKGVPIVIVLPEYEGRIEGVTIVEDYEGLKRVLINL